MKLLNLFFVCLVLFWGTTVLADPPACPVDQGVCFEPLTGELLIQGQDPVSGAYAQGTFDADQNDFNRYNKDGTIYTHLVFNEITDGFYCPPGSLIPDECWPVDLSLPSGGSATGVPPIVDPPLYQFFCPYRVYAYAYVTDPMGDLYKFKALLVSVPSPDGECRLVKFSVKVKPMW